MPRFPFEHEIEVRFRDCDAMGHVNNAVYLSYLEQARFMYWRQATGLPGIPRNIILARVEIDYRVPLTLGDRVIVAMGVAAIGRSSFTIEYELRNARTREVAATAKSVQVTYDYDAGRSVPIPDNIRSKLEASL